MPIVDERSVRSAEVDQDTPYPALGLELKEALRRQVDQAIEPVLADFREQSVRSVRQQVEQARSAKQADEAEERTDTPAQSETSDLSASVLSFLDQAATQWVEARIDDGRDALCSEDVRADVRHSIESTFQPVLETGLELVPNESTRRELQQESEQALDELIKSALDRFCADGILAELQRHAVTAIQALFRFDFANVLREIWEAIRALTRAIVAAVQDEWQRLLHHFLQFLLKAAQVMVGTLLKDGLASVVAVPVEQIEETAETAKETVEEKATELRDRLSERLEELRDRVQDAVEKLKERVADGLKSAASGDSRGDSFGRPPTGRPPNGRPPTGLAPAGRPPSGRPPTGKPPSLTRRKAGRRTR